METKFKETLKRLRISRHLSQQALAEQLGFKQPTIARWETGVLEVDLSTLVKIAQFFGVSTDKLLGLN